MKVICVNQEKCLIKNDCDHSIPHDIQNNIFLNSCLLEYSKSDCYCKTSSEIIKNNRVEKLKKLKK